MTKRRVSFTINSQADGSRFFNNLDFHPQTVSITNPTKYTIYIKIGTTAIPDTKNFDDVIPPNSSYVCDPGDAFEFGLFINFTEFPPVFPLPVVVTFSEGAASVTAPLATAFGSTGGPTMRYCQGKWHLSATSLATGTGTQAIIAQDILGVAGGFVFQSNGIQVLNTGDYLLSIAEDFGNPNLGDIAVTVFVNGVSQGTWLVEVNSNTTPQHSGGSGYSQMIHLTANDLLTFFVGADPSGGSFTGNFYASLLALS